MHYKKFKSNFLEYILYFMLLSISIIILIGGAQYYYAYKALEKNVIDNSINTLQLLKNAHKIVSMQIEKSMDGVLTNPYFLKYMDYFQEKKQYTSMIDMHGQLSSIVSNNNYIKSICIYYRKYDYTLSPNLGIASLSYYKDRDFLESLDEIDYRYNMTLSRKATYTLSGNSEDVITIVKTLPVYYNTRYPDAYVIIDIDPAYIKNALDRLVTHPNAYVQVVDSNRKILAHTAKKQILAEELINLPVTEELSCEKRIVDGEECIVTYTQSHSNGLTYIYVQPLSAVTNSITMLGNTFIIICFTTLALSAIGALLFSYRIFKPIQYIADKCSLAIGNIKRSNDKETDTIMHNLNQIIETNETLEKIKKAHLLSDKNKQFVRLLQSDLGGNLLLQQAEKLGITVQEDREYLLFMADADIIADDLLTKQIRSVLSNHFPTLEVLFFDSVGSYEFIILVRVPKGNTFNFTEIAECFREVLEKGTPLSFGISNAFTDGTNISKAYRQALDALDMRITRGKGKVHFYNEFDAKLYLSYPVAIDNRIFRAIKKGNWDDVKDAMDDFKDYVILNHADPNTVRYFYLQLFCASQNLFYKLGYLSDDHPNLSHLDLLSKTSIDEMNIFILSIYSGLREYMNSRFHSKTKYTELVGEVCQYIDNHLCDDLSIARIGERFSISPSNLRRIFKAELNITIKSYIDTCRVEKAKEHLISNKLMVQDIALLLGFLHPQSFISFFKGMTGMTPGEYRTFSLQKAIEE